MHAFGRYWYPALRSAEIPDFHFHALRHTFASRLAMKGVDLYRVQTLMGHKTPEMTQRYAHLSPDTLREAVERLDAEPAASRG
jgi:integrase